MSSAACLLSTGVWGNIFPGENPGDMVMVFHHTEDLT